MSRSLRSLPWIAAAVAMGLLAQPRVGFGQVGAVSQIQQPAGFLQSGAMFPRIPPQGDWLEVVTVTPRWLVLQNQRGQQFPISFDAVDLFVMRWPTRVDLISPGAMVEVTGIELTANEIRADHMDVFEGQARALVMPTVEQIVGLGRVVTPWDQQQMTYYGQNIPMFPAEYMMPNRLHVVGPMVSRLPIMVAIPGNNAVVVYPMVGGMYITQVTVGSPSFVRPGDLVYAVPIGWNPKSVVLNQLVVYKSMPLNMFAP